MVEQQQSSDPRGPRAEIPGSPERREAACQLTALIQSQLNNLTARPDDMPKTLAVAALARATRLLEGMEDLRMNGFNDVVSLGLRPIMESLLASLYCMLGGDGAADHLRGAHIREIELLSQDIRQHMPPYEPVDDWNGPRDRVNWHDLANTVVGSMLVERFPAEQGAIDILKRLYDGVYRAQSALSIHSGVGSFGGHIIRNYRFVRIAASSYTPDDGTSAVLMGAALVGLAAHFLFLTYGLSTASLDAISERISGGLDVNSLGIVAS